MRSEEGRKRDGKGEGGRRPGKAGSVRRSKPSRATSSPLAVSRLSRRFPVFRYGETYHRRSVVITVASLRVLGAGSPSQRPSPFVRLASSSSRDSTPETSSIQSDPGRDRTGSTEPTEPTEPTDRPTDRPTKRPTNRLTTTGAPLAGGTKRKG